ncbi:hypothetical protein [Amnibacterium kyonggiense]|uniref:Uncharacterized protein n=1 Tax=Amnibacterium kyonggiense TaxID=595671 RepID=A0A4R7FEP4_9MICO|nr:hypothetical protein [Amnibacterium kyonggiense]TDS75799.1 hypothetical protein CLV52_2908 [Amnibacterium kyonggiense]
MSAAASALEGGRVLIGAADLVAPGAIVPGTPFADGLYRALGIRQIVQGLLTGRLLGHRAAAAVDALHAASMVVVALRSTRFRSAALVQVGLGSAFAAAESALGRRS